MPQKILRLGMTECSLLFIYWLNNYKNIYNAEISDQKEILIKWLYTTSGYYDKNKMGNYFNVEHNTNDTSVYTTYMNTLFDFIKNSDIYNFMFHTFTLKHEIEEFKNTINPLKESYLNQKIMFDFIKNKKILIVNPFSSLIKYQLESGNCKKIYNTTPDVDNILIYKFPYTFFNNGPHNNLLETAEYIFIDIINNIKEDYESVLISCGAYGCLIAKKFNEIGKNVCVIGGDLQTFVGIVNQRAKNRMIEKNEYWIEIPDEYKPEGYMLIEDGCYW